MNVVELQRALRQLRCSGIAAGLEVRLLEAQAEKLAAIDFLSRLVQDELVRRQDRLLERRLKQAGFRDAAKRLDTFDYRDVLAHYGVVALPCRVGAPDRKGKVESAIGHTQSTPLKGLRFESLEEAQAYLDRWEARWADTRIHGTTKRQVAAMFTEEQPHLRPLPLEPFRYYHYGTRTVHLDGCVEVAGAYYAPPPGWLGRAVAVQGDDRHVRLLDPTTGALLREHRRQARGRHAIHPDDQPPRTPPTTLTLLARAARAGDPIGTPSKLSSKART